MSLRVTLLLVLALILLAPASSPALASSQEESPAPAGTPQEEEKAEAEQPAPAEEPRAKPADRLSVRVGAASVSLRARGRNRSETLDQFSGLNLQQTTDVNLGTSTGAAVMAEAWLALTPRVFALADVIASKLNGDTVIDNRKLGDPFGPTDLTLAEFQSESDPEYSEWSLGGAFRVWPGKKKGEGSRGYVYALLKYQKVSATFEFDAGALVHDPFSAPVFSAAAGFDRAGRTPASYSMDFENLVGGVRLGGRLSKHFALEGVIAPVWFARYEGKADLGPHGLLFSHIAQHQDPSLHVPGCDPNDTDPLTRCGLIEADLQRHSVTIDERSNRARGINLDLTLDLTINDWFGIVAGIHDHDLRSVGGRSKHLFDNGAIRQGDLIQARLVTQAVSLVGRFRLF